MNEKEEKEIWMFKLKFLPKIKDENEKYNDKQVTRVILFDYRESEREREREKPVEIQTVVP